MRTFNQQVIASQALNVNSNSPFVPLKNIYTYTMAAIITGTPNGTVKLQASNDPETNDGINPLFPQPTHWVDISDSTFAVTTSGISFWNVNGIGYNYVRVVYTDVSGGSSTATMQIVFNGKGA